MPILPNSRYTTGSTISKLPNGAGIYNISVLRTIPNSGSISFSLYVWKQGDRPDTVAAAKLSNPQLWWAIFDFNPEFIYPLSIPPGSIIRIPVGPILGQGSNYQ
jgi:hypothetical protein